MISPYANRVRALNLDAIGRTAGDLYAISTVGGVGSALLTGFILIPSVGVNRLTLIIGFGLLVTAIVGLASERKSILLLAVAILLAGVMGIPLMPYSDVAPDRGLITVEQSPYAKIRSKESRRILQAGASNCHIAVIYC